MKNVARILALSTVSLALAGSAAHAQDLDQPQGFAAITERQVYHANDRVPSRSTASQPVQLQSQDGNTPLGFVAKTERDLFPGNFAQPTSALSRAQVRKEAVAANQAGLIPSGFLAMTEREISHGAVEIVPAQRNLATN